MKLLFNNNILLYNKFYIKSFYQLYNNINNNNKKNIIKIIKNYFTIFPSCIKYFDNHLLIINKPNNIPSQPDQSLDKDVLTLGTQYLQKKYNKKHHNLLNLVHRIDRPASGIMILARTKKAAKRLSKMLRERNIDKIYLAVVHGNIENKGKLMHRIYRKKYIKGKKHPRKVIVTEHDPNKNYENEKSKIAILTYEPLDWMTHHISGPQTLLAIRLETGRRHQIRASLAHIQHPIVGDTLYSNNPGLKDRTIALHSFQINFIHPVSKKFMKLTISPPKHWLEKFPGLQLLNNLINESNEDEIEEENN